MFIIRRPSVLGTVSVSASTPSRVCTIRSRPLVRNRPMKIGTNARVPFVALVAALSCAPSLQSKSAGQIGCVPGDITVRGEESESGRGQSSTTWIAECHGREWICSELITAGAKAASSQVACTEASRSEAPVVPVVSAPSETKDAPLASPENPDATKAEPKAAAGFNLQGNRQDARSACELAGHVWTEVTQNGAVCSGAPQNLGFEAKVLLQFCGVQTCAVAVVSRPKEQWAKSLASIRNALVSKYGESQDNDVRMPKSCLTEANFLSCVTDGRARVSYKWAWPSGAKVRYWIKKDPGPGDDGSGPSIQIVYSKPQPQAPVESSQMDPEPEANPSAL
jgi:hypothetical protein